MLTNEQKDQICEIIRSGCDRETAAKYAGTTWAALHAAMSTDRAFAVRLRRTEAKIELTHMLRLHKASEKEANWRISVWWLESLAPDRYGIHAAGMLNARQLKMFIEHMATTLVSEVRDEGDRERLLNRLHAAAEQLDSFLRDQCVQSESVADVAIHINGDDDNDDDAADFNFSLNRHPK